MMTESSKPKPRAFLEQVDQVSSRIAKCEPLEIFQEWLASIYRQKELRSNSNPFSVPPTEQCDNNYLPPHQGNI
jgi:hypothetical protein